MTKRLILCDCMGSQKIGERELAGIDGLECSRVHTALCTQQMDRAAAALQQGEAIIACQQERTRFEELAEELGAPAPGFVDLRDRAGWSDEGAAAGPKMAALAAEALLPSPQVKALDVVSEGLCLVIGESAAAAQAARDLSAYLGVTLLTQDPGAIAEDAAYDSISGQVTRVEGALGGFTLRIDGLRQVVPGGRGALEFGPPRDGGETGCDIILDLTGGTPLVQAPQKREGYLRADPGSQPAVAAAVLAASQLTGTFEKPLYVSLAEPLCAHSRAEQTGCTRCLDICPTGAITPAGEHVAIDPMICAGCGSCAALCPSGAITAEAPPSQHLMRRMQVLAQSFRAAGGTAPRLLVHDASHGAEAIRLEARHGRGLPADVIPLELEVVSGFGHAEMLAALAHGFAQVTVMTGPATETDALLRERDLAEAIAGAGKVALLEVTDPAQLSAALYGAEVPAPLQTPVLPMGSRRQVTRVAAQAMHGKDAVLDLPEGAPYGAVLVDTEACTLCLSCVSLCPSGALVDNPDMPQLRFQEDACLQCGICATICPETAITLQPRLNLGDEALSQVVLNEEEPFACIECGSLFGVKSTVEKILEKLAGKHAMFASGDAARMIQMCDDCRVRAQYHSQNNPMAGGERPRVRTTEDYYSDRKDH